MSLCNSVKEPNMRYNFPVCILVGMHMNVRKAEPSHNYPRITESYHGVEGELTRTKS